MSFKARLCCYNQCSDKTTLVNKLEFTKCILTNLNNYKLVLYGNIYKLLIDESLLIDDIETIEQHVVDKYRSMSIINKKYKGIFHDLTLTDEYIDYDLCNMYCYVTEENVQIKNDVLQELKTNYSSNIADLFVLIMQYIKPMFLGSPGKYGENIFEDMTLDIDKYLPDITHKVINISEIYKNYSADIIYLFQRTWMLALDIELYLLVKSDIIDVFNIVKQEDEYIILENKDEKMHPSENIIDLY